MKKPNIKFDPKTILAFLKARWSLIVAAIALVASAPVSLYFAGQMARAAHDDVQKKVDADLAEIGSKGSSAKVSYALPPAAPGAEPIAVTYAPNEKLIETFAGLHKKQAEDLGRIVKVVGEFSRQRVALEGATIRREDRKPLLEDFFPEPKDNERLRRSDFQRALTPAHQQLLARYRAGGPPPAEQVGLALQEFRTQRIQAIAGPGATSLDALNPDDQVRLKDSLTAFRVSRYQDRARQLLFYCDQSVFGLPPEDPVEPPTLDQCWEWQHQYWMHEDLLAAAAVANLPAANDGIPRAAVKRIESIKIDEFLWSEDGDGSSNFNGIPLDKRLTITGRVSSKANELFEVRPMTVVAVLATDQINRFIDALAKTNFMSVVDMDLVTIDPTADLAAGFYYGDGHLVRATIKLETIWLRSWLKPTMPLSVQRSLRLAEPDPNAPPDQVVVDRRAAAAGGGPGGRGGRGGSGG